MTRSDVKSLLVKIKVFYPRFEAVEKVEGGFRVPEPVIENWHRMIGFLEMKDAETILEHHLGSENGGRVPGVSLFLSGGKSYKANVWSSATLDQINRCIWWKPERNEEARKLDVKWDDARKVYTDLEFGYDWAYAEE